MYENPTLHFNMVPIEINADSISNVSSNVLEIFIAVGKIQVRYRVKNFQYYFGAYT